MGLHDEAKLDRKFVEFAKQMNLYLNHFPKHEKYGLAQQIRDKAYECYGLIVEAQKRYHKKTTLTSLDIAHEQLRMFIRLEFSRVTLQPVAKGINFVGYRTWRSTRFIRKHSLRQFMRAARRGALASLISILGHARRTASLRHLLTTLKDRHHDLYCELPKACRLLLQPRAAAPTGS